ncbi:MAG: class I SAM-dependent methyltransferase [Nitrososphaerales archaeon]|jgi:SAM-dependent methyltransferase
MGPRAFDRVADSYDATRSLPEPVMDSALDAMRLALADCRTVIDAGVGTGRFAKPLQEMGFDVVGVDVSPGMLAKAREKGVKGLVLADLHGLPARDEAFDAAVVVHVLHLVRDWRAVTKEVGRVCKKKVVSLVGGRAHDGPSVRTDYLRLRSEFGRGLDRFEDGEEGLRRLAPPSQVLRVAEYSDEVSADDEVSYLEGRGSSVTWDLDEDTHRRIIAELRATYRGRILQKKRLIELAVWDAGRFLAAGRAADLGS